MGQLFSPSILCTQVDESGNTTISWEAINDPNGEFVAYHVFASSGGAFNEIGVVNNISVNSFLDNVNNASLSAMCYYVVVEYNSGMGNVMAPDGAQSCNVSVSLTTTVGDPGILEITWDGPVAVNGFVLMWDDPWSNWSNSVALPSNQNSYQLEITTCGDVLSFLVFSNQATCPSISPIVEGVFYDQTPPATPSITSVTVSNGRPLVQWDPSSSPDTEGYILYGCGGGGEFIVDTIFGGNTTSYSDLSVISANQSACYTLAAFDNCPTGNPPSPNTSDADAVCNCTILLAPLVQTECSSDINLIWTPYNGWDGGVMEYVIYHAQGTANFFPVDTVSGNQLNVTHHLSGFVELNHSFYVLALSNNGFFSISNVRTITLNYPQAPDFCYITDIDVDQNNVIHINAKVASTPTIHEVVLQQYDDYFLEWNNIEVQENTNGSNQFVVEGLQPQYFSYYFRIKVVNQCGDTVLGSASAKNVLLQGLVNGEGNSNFVKWTDYLYWPSGVEKYELHRYTSMDSLLLEDYQEAYVLDSVYDAFVDQVDSLLEGSGEFLYRVKANGFSNDLEMGSSYESWSNIVTLTQPPRFYAPNAILINGINDTFRPVISFAKYDKYKLYVFSKWGDSIFISEDIKEGWNGRNDKGEVVPQGVYVYHVVCSKGNDDIFDFKGLITVLYAE